VSFFSQQTAYQAFQEFHPYTAQEAIVDVTAAANSADALKIISQVIGGNTFGYWVQNGGRQIHLNAGSLFLTAKIISKINTLLRQYGTALHTVYSTLPQTQQGALDSGFFVKEAPRYAPPITVGGTVAPQLSDTEEALAELFGQARQRKAAQAQQFVKPSSYDHQGVSLPPTPVTPSGGALMAFDQLNDLVLPQWEDIPSPSKEPESLTFSQWQHSAAAKMVAPPVNVPKPVVEKSVPIELAPFQPDEVLVDRPTYYFGHTLRSGQTIRFDGNLVIVGDVNNGSEIAATGSILVWGELKGIAHAGAKGDTSAEIRAWKIEAVQLRIAQTIARRPDRVTYHKVDDANGLPQPEIARIADGEIRIFKDIVGYSN